MTQFKINQNEEKAWVTFLVDDNGDRRSLGKRVVSCCCKRHTPRL